MSYSTKTKELQAFPWILNYLRKYSHSMAEVCESLRQLPLVKAEWMWNAEYQSMFDKANFIIKEDGYVILYNEMKPLYLETDACRVELGAHLLQARKGTCCPRDELPDSGILRSIFYASKSFSALERKYSNIERETLGILHCLEKFITTALQER